MRRTVRLLSLVMLCALVVVAQQQPTRAPASETPAQGEQAIRVTTHLVVEEVTAKDKRAKPIEGLPANDFVLTEDGVPQTISFVEFQRLQSAANTAQPAQLLGPVV